MAILFRCDICQKEVQDFWNVMIERKRLIKGSSGPTVEKSFSFDVCSAKCESAAIERILTIVAPLQETIT